MQEVHPHAQIGHGDRSAPTAQAGRYAERSFCHFLVQFGDVGSDRRFDLLLEVGVHVGQGEHGHPAAEAEALLHGGKQSRRDASCRPRRHWWRSAIAPWLSTLRCERSAAANSAGKPQSDGYSVTVGCARSSCQSLMAVSRRFLGERVVPAFERLRRGGQR